MNGNSSTNITAVVSQSHAKGTSCGLSTSFEQTPEQTPYFVIDDHPEPNGDHLHNFRI